MSADLNESFKALNVSLGAALLQADRENRTVYLQRIPAISDLPQIAPAALVKPLAPVLDRGRDGLFSSVIPDGRCKFLPLPSHDRLTTTTISAFCFCRTVGT